MVLCSPPCHRGPLALCLACESKSNDSRCDGNARTPLCVARHPDRHPLLAVAGKNESNSKTRITHFSHVRRDLLHQIGGGSQMLLPVRQSLQPLRVKARVILFLSHFQVSFTFRTSRFC